MFVEHNPVNNVVIVDKGTKHKRYPVIWYQFLTVLYIRNQKIYLHTYINKLLSPFYINSYKEIIVNAGSCFIYYIIVLLNVTCEKMYIKVIASGREDSSDEVISSLSREMNSEFENGLTRFA